MKPNYHPSQLCCSICVTTAAAFAVVLLALPTAIRAADAAKLRATAASVFKPLPDRMPGGEKDTPALVALGKALYLEKKLSKNESQSCNSCHQIDDNKAGVDNEPTSEGAFKERGSRNSPTTWNAGFHFAQFWDGRAATLEDQAKGPVLNPVEMSMPSEVEVVQRLKASADYPARFKQAFPGQADAISYDNMAKAIAAFERTLVSHDRFDEFLKGSDTALTDAEFAGLNLFLQTACTTCHNGSTIGGNSYQKSGLVNPYEFQKDRGRYDVTKNEDDDFKFKVPSLRNVALTSPYFHDGKVARLEDVVKRMAWMQLGKELSPPEIDSIVAFLKTFSGQGLKSASAH